MNGLLSPTESLLERSWASLSMAGSRASASLASCQTAGGWAEAASLDGGRSKSGRADGGGQSKSGWAVASLDGSQMASTLKVTLFVLAYPLLLLPLGED
uniref:Uncharacterized protein n=1 Tax=Plectus sambesii TaxID=2011161 RepID=A0A914WMR2_9BILA